VIRVDGLVKSYGTSGKRSVDDLSFEVAEGEVFAFLGPNGAGKSTTAKVLTTLLAPTSGIVEVAGYNVLKQSRQVRERIGYVAQNTGIDHFMTGRENLMLIGNLYRLRGAFLEKRVDEMLGYFGLTDVADQMCAAYSGGMQRKLDIATALLHQPKVLFMDEPTLGLDAQSRIDLWEYVRHLNDEMGVTVFLTTHYLDEADKLAHRVGIIDEGVLQCVGTPSTLKDLMKGDSVALAFDDGVIDSARPLLEKAAFSKEVLDEDDGLRIYVDNGGETIADMIHLLSGNDIRVKSVTLARPTLDDVFIKFTGKSMNKVEEKIKPWWAEWAGDNWEQVEAEGDWGGNKWVNADGSPKDKKAFEEWSDEEEAKADDALSQEADGVDSGHPAGQSERVSEDADASPERQETDVSEEKTEADQPGGGAGWSGNEWVNADGSPKDPKAMKKWLEGSSEKKAE